MDMQWKTSCALIVAVALSTTQALAQSAPGTPAAATSSDPRQEGVKVHGDWTLTVRNPDGTVAAQYEFKNALAINSFADLLLAEILEGKLVPGKWTVKLGGTGFLCFSGPSCSISESGTPEASDSKDLTKSVDKNGPDSRRLVLRGSVRIFNSSTITTVNTALGHCAPAASPPLCFPGGNFTERILNPGVPVVQEQLVEVKVVISFS